MNNRDTKYQDSTVLRQNTFITLQLNPADLVLPVYICKSWDSLQVLEEVNQSNDMPMLSL